MKTIIYTPSANFDATTQVHPIDFSGAMSSGAIALRDMLEGASLREMLGVKLHASSKEVGEAFRERVVALSGTFGVPRCADDLEALEAAFEALKDAREVLLDEGRRADYIRRCEEVGHLLSHTEHASDDVDVVSVVEPLTFRPAEEADSRLRITPRRVARFFVGLSLALMNLSIYLLIGHMLASSLL